MITLSNLHKTYGANGPAILQDISLSVSRGSFVCLLGPSGCGKTTLLNLVAGFTQASSGSLLVQGKKVSAPGPDRGVVFQDPTLFPWLTVVKNVAFGLEQQHGDRRDCLPEAMHFLELVGMADQARTYPRTLSGGMRQRVAIARVLALKSEVLLMDEPFSALDANTRERLQVELLRLWGMFGQTVLYVTHSVEEAAFLGQRVIIMGPAPKNIHAEKQITLPHPRQRSSREMGALVQSMRQELDALPCCIGNPPTKQKEHHALSAKSPIKIPQP